MRRDQGFVRPEDTHYLGSAQWEYNRQCAALAGTLSDERDKDLRIREKIYVDASARRPPTPGDPDTYRRTQYVVKHEREEFVAVPPS